MPWLLSLFAASILPCSPRCLAARQPPMRLAPCSLAPLHLSPPKLPSLCRKQCTRADTHSLNTRPCRSAPAGYALRVAQPKFRHWAGPAERVAAVRGAYADTTYLLFQLASPSPWQTWALRRLNEVGTDAARAGPAQQRVRSGVGGGGGDGRAGRGCGDGDSGNDRGG
eukprot:5966420-Pleurochrysis_carterae.AAC.1